ncbi:MAG: hypothetical protein HKO56_03695 [Bacteroidia bacterium]|nr:hypothetical protein [Bacteroidia bacterium]NNM15740.1 hypothetical protein [Bacteroidia bacterium]
MKKLIALFALSTVAFISFPCITDAQSVTKLSYYCIEEYSYDETNGQYRLVKDYHLNGTITITDKELHISSNGKMAKKTFQVISQHRDNGSNLEIYICYKESGKCTLALSPDKSTISILDKNKKYIYKLKS